MKKPCYYNPRILVDFCKNECQHYIQISECYLCPLKKKKTGKIVHKEKQYDCSTKK